MKIKTLHLDAYGPFTGKVLEFSESPDRLNLIYGPNEAGKSSLLRAIRAFLFGIPARTPDNFLHTYGDLQIRGELTDADGVTHRFMRVKGNQDTLRDFNGSPVPDSQLAQLLGGVEEHLFDQFFGLDSQRLAEGGQALLEGKGELGQALLSVGMGGLNLPRLIQKLQTQSEGLFGPRTPSRPINQLITQHSQLKKQERETALSVHHWQSLEHELRQLEQKRTELTALLQEKSAEAQRLQRLQKAQPLLSQRTELEAQLEALGAVPEISGDFAERHEAASRSLRDNQQALEETTPRLQRLKSEVQNLSPDNTLLGFEETLNHLHQRIGQFRKDDLDKERLRGERKRFLRDARSFLQDLQPGAELEDAQTLRLSNQLREQLRLQAERHEELLRDQQALTQEQSKLRRNLEQAKDKDVETPDDEILSGLRRLIVQAEGQQTEVAGLQRLQTMLTEQQRQAELAFQKLLWWDRSPDELEVLRLPPQASFDQHGKRMQEAEQRGQTADADLQRKYTELRDLEEQLQSATGESDIPTEALLAETRQQRDHLLLQLKHLLFPKTPSDELDLNRLKPLYTQLLHHQQEADQLADRLRREADRVAQYANFQVRQQRLREEQQELAQRLVEAESEVRRRDEAWSGFCREYGLPEKSVAEVAEWTEQAQAWKSLRQEIHKHLREHDQLRQRIAAACQKLADALLRQEQAVPEAPSLELLLTQARTFVDHLETRRQEAHAQKRSEQQARNRLGEIEGELKELRTVHEQWSLEWAEFSVTLPLSASPSVREVHAFQTAHDQLFGKLREAEDHQIRIDGMERDREEFEQEVKQLLDNLQRTFSTPSSYQVIELLHQELQEAKEIRVQLREKTKTLNEVQEQSQSLEDGIRDAQQQLDRLTTEAQCPQEQLEVLTQKVSERDELRSRLKDREDALHAVAGSDSLEDLLESARTVSQDQIPGMLDELKLEMKALEKQRDQVMEELGNQKGELKRNSGQSASLQAAEDLAQTEACLLRESQRYVDLKVAEVALRSELDRLSRQNQSPLLQQASRLFQSMTCASFDGLALQLEGEQPRIVGNRPDGKPVEVFGFSDGVCDQCFLALRLAYLIQKGSSPLPFIADDLLVSFDDQRATAMFGALAEILPHAQLLFFTHHQHLHHLATQALGPERLHFVSLA